jgi:photosystem II stability/assembly factor-like uncharacterized protein
MLLRPSVPWIAVATLAALLRGGEASAQGFNALATKDGVDVWAVGDAGEVYRSLNGGAVWATLPMGIADHNGVAAKGSRVWVVDDGGTLWTSTDDGASFGSQTLAGGADLEAIWFADDATGWIAGAGGTILHTTDAGGAWTAQTSGTGATLRAIRFADASEGWAVGSGGTVAHTTDGGATWSASTPFPSFTKDLYDVDADGATVYVTGTYGFMAKSTNGGGAWSTIDLWLLSHSDVNGIEVLPGGTFWLCGGGGFLRRSLDGGNSFFYPLHPIVTGLSDVVFFDANKGWACAERSKNVVRTTDGGATWSVPGGGAFTYSWTKKQGEDLNQVRGNTFFIDRVNRNKLWAVQGRTVYASWDLGETWAPIATIGGTTSRTNSFYVSSSDTMTWVASVQDVDRIVRTTDGGATWTSPLVVTLSEYGMPLEQDPGHPDNLYVGAEDGTIRKSTDFGATWTTVSTPGFSSPCDLVAVPDTTGILYLGDTGGSVFRSTDDGVTWSLRLSTGASETPTIGVSALDNREAFATTWTFGGVNRTTDHGAAWTNVTAQASSWGCDVAKDDPYVAMFSVYTGSTSYLSTNNGANFSLTAPITGSNYGILLYDRGTYFAHQSGGIWKATVSQPGMPVNNAQILALTAPFGGEVWQYNETRNVTWVSQNIATVKIEYQQDLVSPWQLITAATSAPAGSYPWVIPNVPTTQASVRVTDIVDGAPVAQSGSFFSIIVPAIASNRSSLDFGPVYTTATKRDTLRLVNAGTATLVVSSIAPAGGISSPFSPNRTSLSIPAGSSDTLEVTYAPTAEGTQRDTLLIASNAPASVLSIPLVGVGLSPVGVVASTPTPSHFELRANAPNPFGDRGTTIGYTLPAESDVSLVVYNAAGQQVSTLVRDRQPAGAHSVRFPGPDAGGGRSSLAALPSGVYFYRLTAGRFVETKRMILVR